MFKKIGLGLLLATLCSSASAILDLSLTQGFDAAIPITIVPFGDISPIVSNDLKLSGQFRQVDGSSLQQFPDESPQLIETAKNDLKVNNVVTGSVVSSGNDNFKATVNLLDVYKANNSVKNQDGQRLSAKILSRVYTFRSNQQRSVAHRISDAIYEKLTGVPGAFSTRIAYIAKMVKGNRFQYQLLVVDSDGFNPRPLLISRYIIMSPAWSPTGKQVAYVSFEDHYPAIYVADVTTGDRRLISRFEGINGAPAFSPDGRKLAVVLSKSGSPNLYLYDLVSNSLQQLTKDSWINTEPVWMPDGRSLLFTSNRNGSVQIYQYQLAENTIKRLTYDGGYNASAQVTQDGKTLVFLHQDNGTYTVAKQDLETGQLTVLTPGVMAESPHLAPNGQMVVYVLRQGSARQLALVSMNGRTQVTLPAPDNAMVQGPAWSPFLT